MAPFFSQRRVESWQLARHHSMHTRYRGAGHSLSIIRPSLVHECQLCVGVRPLPQQMLRGSRYCPFTLVLINRRRAEVPCSGLLHSGTTLHCGAVGCAQGVAFAQARRIRKGCSPPGPSLPPTVMVPSRPELSQTGCALRITPLAKFPRSLWRMQ